MESEQGMEPDVELHERMARIETQLSSHIDDEEKHMHQMDEKLDNIQLELSRYRGFIGGILLVATAVGTFLKFFLEDVVKVFK